MQTCSKICSSFLSQHFVTTIIPFFYYLYTDLAAESLSSIELFGTQLSETLQKFFYNDGPSA
jgi:hypothetical protein